MRSVRDVTKAYNLLLEGVKTSEFYKIDLTNRVNCYTCSNRHITKTIDIHAGVTPMMNTCAKCNETARSSFYKDIAPSQKPTHEWYRPTLQQVLKMRGKENGLLDHVLQGGLDYRKRIRTTVKEVLDGARFLRPTDKQVIEIAILFNDGSIDEEKLTDMVAMADLIIDRLYDNGDVSKPSIKELNITTV